MESVVGCEAAEADATNASRQFWTAHSGTLLRFMHVLL
jgi:hypothetical protein